MKKICILFIVISLVFFSCEKTPINGKLDGMWQLMQIDYVNGDSEDKKTDRIYYNVQLHLIGLKIIDDNNLNHTQNYLGRFKHLNDSLHIEILEEAEPSVIESLKVFGIDNIIQDFKVEKLTGSKMTLKSGYARLYFRKF